MVIVRFNGFAAASPLWTDRLKQRPTIPCHPADATSKFKKSYPPN
jgi:hypothetical protein